jgi:hypothetical protein
VDGAFDLRLPGKSKPKGRLFLSVQYLPFAPDNPNNAFSSGLAVPATYWAAQPGNLVRWYQSAHNTPETVAPCVLPSGEVFAPRGCWVDVAEAIAGAEKFVYLTGWSMLPSTRLVRPDGETIGELLKAASDRGVQVRRRRCGHAQAHVPALMRHWNDSTEQSRS